MSALSDPALDRHRKRLEESLGKLQKALMHWQILSAEYEAFREELQGLPDSATREDMLAVGMDFGGTVVDEKEIKALLGDKIGKRRTLGQVIATVGHRIDYVQENVIKVEKQLEKGETKLASLLVVTGPDLTNEEGLPIMDIREELDEEDNVIAATVNGNDPTAPMKPVDVDGIEKIVEVTKGKEVPRSTPDPKTPENQPKKPSPLREVTTQDPSPPPKNLKNAEIYACEPKETPEVKIISSREEDGGGRVKIVDDVPDLKEEDWVQEVPGEPEEDAEMRRQMLKYNMQEIGAVVAQINLDEDGDYYGYEDSDYDEDEDEDEDEEEDGYGRATYKVITPELQREMEELQRRVRERAEAARNGGSNTTKVGDNDQDSGKKGVRFAKELDIAPPPAPASVRHFTPGSADIPSFPTPPSAANTEDAIPLLLDLLAMDEMRKEEMRKEEMRKAGIKIAGEAPKTQKPSIFKSGKTTAPETVASAVSELPAEENVVPESVISSTVLERPPGLSTPNTPAEPPSVKTRKPSRFMAGKATSTTNISSSIFKNTSPSTNEPEEEEDDDGEPKQPTISNFIKEREPDANSTVEPPDELDPSIHRREVATEFHRMRTKMIQQQGGFVETEEEGAIVPLNQDGERKKVSRFKAARIKAMEQ